MSKANTNSIIAFPSDYVVVDLETTGLSPYHDSIMEISALKIKNNTAIDKFSSLTKPNNYFIPSSPNENCLYDNSGIPYSYVCDFITNLTGITNKMLKDAPDLKGVLEDFILFLSDSVIVGHNVSFDINFLKTNTIEFLNKELNFHNYIDTMRIARKIFKDKKHHRLIDVANYLDVQIDETKTHRGLYDCEITLNCYTTMQDRILKEYETYDNFIDLFKRSCYTKFDPRLLHAESNNIDETNPLFNKECIFTGTLEKLVRKEAQQIVVNLGGTCGKSVTKTTNYLILGNNDYCKSIKDGKSSKHKKAEKLKEKGMDIEIMPEDVFYDLSGIEL